MARIVVGRARSSIVRRIGYPNTLGNGGTWHCKGPQRAGINDRFAKAGKIIGPRFVGSIHDPFAADCKGFGAP
jgi:hypothetical protein